MKSDRSTKALSHFGHGRTIGFQAAVSDTSDGKHPESSRQLIVRSRCLLCTVKGKVFPYSLPSVGPGADPGVQAVSPQVT